MGIKKRLLFLIPSAILLLCLVAMPAFASDGPGLSTAPDPIDPQSWQMNRDRTWDDFIPNPVIDWITEVNPEGYYNPRNSSNRVSTTKGALVLLEYYDRPFITAQPVGSDVLGYYLYKEDGSGLDYEKGIVHNPVLSQPRTLAEKDYSTDPADPNFQKDPVFANWWKDFLIGDHPNNHGSGQREFFLETSYGKWDLEFEAFGPFEIPAFEFEIRDSYQGTNELPPSFRGASGFTTDSIDTHAFTIMQNKLDPPAHRYFRNNFDFFHILHAGYDESGVWQEFGMGQYASRADLPDELTPIGRMHKVEEVFTARPELLQQYITRYPNSAIFKTEKARYDALAAEGKEAEFVFHLAEADWEWANNWKYQTQRNTRYVNWTSWEAGVGEWSHKSNTSSFGSSMAYSTQGECDGMATFAHEFGHIANLGDNYGNPYTARVSAATEPWELMSRGSFAGPFGDHARWTAPGIEAGSVPTHFMTYNKIQNGYYDDGDLLIVSNQQLAGSTPVVAEIVARNIPLNNKGLYPQLDEYGLKSPNFYKAIRLNFGSGAWADQATRKTTGFSNYAASATRMGVEVVQRTGYDSYTPDDGVIISRNNRVVASHQYDIAMIDYVVPDGLGEGKDDWVSYTVGHAQQMLDDAFKAGKSVTDTGYYRSEYDPEDPRYANEEARYYTSESSGMTWQKAMIKPGSIQQWEERAGREIASGDTVNEFYDPYNKLHFYILARSEHPGRVVDGKQQYFLSYTVGVLHDDGVAVDGELTVEGGDLRIAVPGKVATAKFDITNTGTATDIVRVGFATNTGWDVTLLNDLYAIGAGETITVPLYVTIPEGVYEGSLEDLTLTLNASSESNAEKIGSATIDAAKLIANPENYGGLTLTTSTDFVQVGEEFTVNAKFSKTMESNAAILDFTFKTGTFEYKGFDAAPGVTFVSEETTDKGVRITVMITDYNTSEYGDLKLEAKKSCQLDDVENNICLAANFVLRHADGTKEVIVETANTAVTTGPPPYIIDKYDLITLSDMIDVFGMKDTDPKWRIYKIFDFDDNGEIDVNDIAFFASNIK